MVGAWASGRARETGLRSPAVESDIEAVRSALVPTTMPGVEVTELWTGWNAAYAIEIPAARLREAWREARIVAADLGQYPCAFASFTNDPVYEDVFERPLAGGEDSPSELIAAASGISHAQSLDLPHRPAVRAHWRAAWEEVVDVALERTRAAYGDAPTPADIGADDVGRDKYALERRLLAWEQSHAAPARPLDDRYLDWFEPPRCSLVFLPIDRSEHVPAYVEFYGAGYRGGPERLIATLSRWRERYGAEVVACWSTMLQLCVARPPSTLEEAVDLAIEHDIVASSTLAGPGVSTRDHARALLGRSEWFLHDRP